MIKILSLSDVELGIIYNSSVADRFPDIDLIISCGDLPVFYLDFISSALKRPIYYVYGNHHNLPIITEGKHGTYHSEKDFGSNLHRACKTYDNQLLLAGVEGCLRYNRGAKQYSQREMWSNVFSLVPQMLLNRFRYGRYLDIFVTHAPPWKVNDCEDRAHIGIKAFSWLDKVFSPKIHLHGHIHIYRNDLPRETLHHDTRVINSYGYQEIGFH